ncbi:hypothetical protein [Mycoplasma sp. P36-A1]|uniref:hypothetical protein n=1 Tax=Mycoplasma sp. P36-A1 TaxID=3252900 RepID=UPI003C2C9312
MIDKNILEIKDEVLRQKVGMPKFARLVKKMQIDGTYIIDFVEFLYGEDKATDIIDSFESYEELGIFLQPMMQQITSLSTSQMTAKITE